MEPAKEPLNVGQHFEHKVTKREFEVIGFCHVKDAGDANWQAGVIFKVVDNSADLPYVRSISDFLDKHTLIGDSDDGNHSASDENLSGGTTHWVEPGKN
jgi:hypothetical protein